MSPTTPAPKLTDFERQALELLQKIEANTRRSEIRKRMAEEHEAIAEHGHDPLAFTRTL
jgi:hypothetical protein